MNNAIKYALPLVLLFIGISGYCSEVMTADGDSRGYFELNDSSGELSLADNHPETTEAKFRSLARKHKIPTRKITKMVDVNSGYYIIAGAFGEQENARKFIRSLSSTNLKPFVIYNPENRLNYVSLEYHKSGLDAINSCLDGLKRQYSKDVWILQVESETGTSVRPLKKPSGTITKGSALNNFGETARKYRIAHRIIDHLEAAQNGFYLVAGVFGQKENALQKKAALKRKGLQAEILYHPSKKMNYVSVAYAADWKDAISGVRNQLSGKYTEKLWILGVVDKNTKTDEKIKAPVYKAPSPEEEEKRFYALAEDKDIPTRSDPGFVGLDNGFYMVAGVFGDTNNAKTYLSKLQKRLPGANLAIHPKSQLSYIYLDHYEKGIDALKDYQSGMSGSFKDPLWILHINRAGDKLSSTKEQITSEKKNLYQNSRPVQRKSFLNRKFASSIISNDKLLEKADLYFNKMWYAEAAELYELVLNENPENQTFEIIRKAGDSHYFNTNMERAFYWYDLLYSKYKSDMRAENLFKYAHSLKGTGKYGRAKRLMKLYNKALKKEGGGNRYRARPGDAVLDNIINTEEQNININNVAVNSEYSDFSPMFYQDDKMVFASAMDSAFFNTRRYKWNDQPYLDLYVAKLNEQSNEVRDAVKFSKKINTKYHEASVTFSPDQQTIYFTRNNYGKKLKRDSKGVNNLKIYMSRKNGDSWSEAVELPFNSDEYSSGHPALSPDGSKLYFVSDMPGSMGKTDLFVVDVLGDGQFSEPRNLGPEINTERREMFPFISDEKLYFASDGHIGLGGLDIYEVAITEEGFSEVKNMGQPINSKRDDFSYIIREETQKGFFASNRRGGKGDDDIYSFKRILPEEPNENAIAGVVTEVITGEVMPKAMVELLDENNVKLMEVEADADGSFVFEELDSNTRYVVRTTKDSYIEDEQFVTTEDNKRIEIEVKMNQLAERVVIEDGITKLKIDMIYFDFDKFNIRNDAAEELDKLVEVMNTYPTMVIKVESHTDSRGKRAYNRYLSDKRAKSTRNYLISKGIDPKRIESAIGYGEERLLNECNGSVRCSSAKHQLNRRSEFIIVSM